MIENGLVYAVNKENLKNNKHAAELKRADKIGKLFKKYNVNFADKFSIKDWSIKDIVRLLNSTDYNIDLITKNDNKKISIIYDYSTKRNRYVIHKFIIEGVNNLEFNNFTKAIYYCLDNNIDCNKVISRSIRG